MDHQYHECHCHETFCMFCDGGVAWCRVCGAGEAQLLAHCPGWKLTEEQLADVVSGKIVSIEHHATIMAIRRTKKR